MLFLGLMSVGLSLLIFGSGDLLVFSGKIIIFSSGDVLWRFLFALSFLASSLVENAIGPIVASMSVIIILFILSALDFNVFHAMKPYLFVTYMNDWNQFFRYDIDYKAIFDSALVLLIHILGFYGITLYFFNRKDILS